MVHPLSYIPNFPPQHPPKRCLLSFMADVSFSQNYYYFATTMPDVWIAMEIFVAAIATVDSGGTNYRYLGHSFEKIGFVRICCYDHLL